MAPSHSGTFQPLQHRSGTLRERLHSYTKSTLGAGGSINDAVRFHFSDEYGLEGGTPSIQVARVKNRNTDKKLQRGRSRFGTPTEQRRERNPFASRFPAFSIVDDRSGACAQKAHFASALSAFSPLDR
jgi:hypothetical protein